MKINEKTHLPALLSTPQSWTRVLTPTNFLMLLAAFFISIELSLAGTDTTFATLNQRLEDWFLGSLDLLFGMIGIGIGGYQAFTNGMRFGPVLMPPLIALFITFLPTILKTIFTATI